MDKKKNLYFKLFIQFILLFVLFSCEKDALFNAGQTVSREVLLANNINSIEVQAMFKITLVQDSLNKAIVTCGENLQPNIDIFVIDNVLHLKNSVKYNWSRPYKKIDLELHLISTPVINVRNPVYITTQDTFKTKEFFLIDWEQFTELDVTLDVNNCAIDVSSENFGHYAIKGKAESATFKACGSAFIDAKSMKVKYCTVSQKSIGDIYVNVINELRVSFKNSGLVFYYGNPTLFIENQTYKNRLIHLTE